MTFELKDLLAWVTAIVTIVAQFFHLKGRITVIEARQKDDRESVRESFREIKEGLQRIEGKLDGKADK